VRDCVVVSPDAGGAKRFVSPPIVSYTGLSGALAASQSSIFYLSA
jgi:hypothetical protein